MKILRLNRDTNPKKDKIAPDNACQKNCHAAAVINFTQWEKSIMQFLDKGPKSIGLKAYSLPPLYVS